MASMGSSGSVFALETPDSGVLISLVIHMDAQRWLPVHPAYIFQVQTGKVKAGTPADGLYSGLKIHEASQLGKAVDSKSPHPCPKTELKDRQIAQAFAGLRSRVCNSERLVGRHGQSVCVRKGGETQ